MPLCLIVVYIPLCLIYVYIPQCLIFVYIPLCLIFVYIRLFLIPSLFVGFAFDTPVYLPHLLPAMSEAPCVFYPSLLPPVHDAPSLLPPVPDAPYLLPPPAASQEDKSVSAGAGAGAGLGAEEESLDYESKVLSQFCHAQQHLLVTYTTLSGLNTNSDTSEDGAMQVGVIVVIIVKMSNKLEACLQR